MPPMLMDYTVSSFLSQDGAPVHHGLFPSTFTDGMPNGSSIPGARK